MMLTTLSEHPLSYIGVADTGLLAVVGYAVVFVGLIALMLVVMLLGKAFTAAESKKAAKTAEVAPATVVAEPVAVPAAPGTAGQLKIYDVNPKTAAIIMAIVADKMGKPLNELRFISIKEVK